MYRCFSVKPLEVKYAYEHELSARRGQAAVFTGKLKVDLHNASVSQMQHR